MAVNPPQTIVRSSHSLTIRVPGIGAIGLINGWNPTISRTITPVYEINVRTSGDPLEKIPGNVTGQTIAVQRYDLYVRRMEVAFGTPDIMMLSTQDTPFEVVERWQYPDTTIETLRYTGCWFSNIGKNYRSDGDRIVNVNATLEYVKRELVSPAA
ncbi:hypothetical protein KAR91_60085 [Candidatus Pacearchaeota archaeon]|nr:hypothetical protein [Candidatus Pacearchaeota archaeon]